MSEVEAEVKSVTYTSQEFLRCGRQIVLGTSYYVKVAFALYSLRELSCVVGVC